MAKDIKRIWVHEKFKKKLQETALNKDISLVKLTEQMAEPSDLEKEVLGCKKKERRKAFDFNW